MTGIRRRSQKNRIWRSVRCLKASCHFSRVRRIHPAIVIAGKKQYRRILRSRVNVVEWRIGIERLELLRVLDRAVLG